MKPLDPELVRMLSGLDLAVARLRAGGGEGERRADRRGGRVEFADRRPYVPGDDVRAIDWAAHARTGRIWVREYERTEDVEVLVVVDASASMARHGKFDTALGLAWAVAFVALRTGGRARAALAFDDRLELSAEAEGLGSLSALASFLGRSIPSGATRLSASFARIPPARRATRIVVVVSDLLGDDDGRDVLATLVRRGDRVAVVHVVAAGDFAPRADAGDDAVDVETGRRVRLTDAGLAAAHRYAARREQDWRTFSSRHRLRYVPIDASAPLGRSAVRALRDGGVLA